MILSGVYTVPSAFDMLLLSHTLHKVEAYSVTPKKKMRQAQIVNSFFYVLHIEREVDIVSKTLLQLHAS